MSEEQYFACSEACQRYAAPAFRRSVAHYDRLTFCSCLILPPSSAAESVAAFFRIVQQKKYSTGPN